MGNGRALPSLALPPIDRLPSSDVEPNVLAAFVQRRARAWGGVAVPLSPAVTAALWILLALNLSFGGWLLAVRSGVAVCSGTLCAVATLGHHPLLTLVLAALCTGALAAVTPITRGLSRAGGPQLAAVVLAALCGVIALAGVVALLVFAALCLVVAFGMFVAVVDRL